MAPAASDHNLTLFSVVFPMAETSILPAILYMTSLILPAHSLDGKFKSIPFPRRLSNQGNSKFFPIQPPMFWLNMMSPLSFPPRLHVHLKALDPKWPRSISLHRCCPKSRWVPLVIHLFCTWILTFYLAINCTSLSLLFTTVCHDAVNVT